MFAKVGDVAEQFDTDQEVLDVIFRTNVKLKSSSKVDIEQTVMNNVTLSSTTDHTNVTGDDSIHGDTAAVTALPQTTTKTSEFCDLIPAAIQGKVVVQLTLPQYADIEAENKNLPAGGESSPERCKANFNVAIIVPYRDRADQLLVFLRHIHPFLRKQELHYRIYVVNQADRNNFNRAMLMNVGFTEAMKDFAWDCFIFHDVDLLPEDDRNIYNCPDQPRHMSVAVDKFKYKLPYKTIFGGVAAIRTDQFKRLNGFSNLFWGWGGEDDDMSRRIHYRKLKIVRYKPDIARYTMIKHKQQPVNKERVKILKTSRGRFLTDGLNNLKYKLEERKLLKLYTNISVQLEHTEFSQKSRFSQGKQYIQHLRIAKAKQH